MRQASAYRGLRLLHCSPRRSRSAAFPDALKPVAQSAEHHANVRANDEGAMLRQPSIIGQLSPGDRERVMTVARHHRFAAGEVIFRQGDPHGRIHIIEKGLVRAYYCSLAGDEITLAYWLPGDLLGAPQVFGGGCYAWSCRAMRNTDTVGVNGSDLRELVQEIPALALGIIEALSFKVQWLSGFVQRLGTQGVSERLASLLGTLGKLHGVVIDGGAVAIVTPFTHEDLATMVGASRPWITAALARFQEQGIIRTGKRKLVILRPDLLAEAAMEHRPVARRHRLAPGVPLTGQALP